MVRHHPSKFGGNSHCGSRDIMFVAAKGQDSTCPRLDQLLLFTIYLLLSLKYMACHAHTYKISRQRRNNFLVCPMKDF